MIFVDVIPIGSEHITSDIAIGLRCPINLAERVKLEYGSVRVDSFQKREEIDLSELSKEENVEDDLRPISKKYLAEIIEARVEEIFEKIDSGFKKIERSGMLPAGVFFVGGGSKLDGLVDLAKEKLRLPAALGSVQNINTVIDKTKDPEFLTALGLAIWGDQLNDKQNRFNLKLPGKEVISKTVEGVKKFFNSLLP